MVFDVPNLNLFNVNKFLKELSKIVQDNSKAPLILNFSKMTHFTPLPMLLLGSFIQSCEKKEIKVIAKGISSEKHGYGGTMGFFSYCSSMDSFDIVHIPQNRQGNNNYIPITLININALRNDEEDNCNLHYYELFNKKASQLARILARTNEGLHHLLQYLITEITRNTPEHSRTDDLYICGQYWRKKNYAEIAILDMGIGVFESIRKRRTHKKYVENAYDALEYVLKPGISCQKENLDDPYANSGYGLYMTSEICNRLNGTFCMVSNDYCLKYNKGKRNFYETSFKGTAISIAIPISNIPDNAYEIKKITEDILRKGENEAANIKGANRFASEASKGKISKL